MDVGSDCVGVEDGNVYADDAIAASDDGDGSYSVQ